MCNLGRLVKIAQTVEEQVGTFRDQAEPKLRSTFQEAETEWLRLKNRTHHSNINDWEMRSRKFVSRTEVNARSKLADLIGRSITELEKIRARLLQTTH